mmetsp:Transcript_35399/g.91983  ORF Transcript_35399/g.91983 Transcript_35399/m.91983 type:complete len:211 (+) Transcript_35399:273-905(+)
MRQRRGGGGPCPLRGGRVIQRFALVIVLLDLRERQRVPGAAAVLLRPHARRVEVDGRQPEAVALQAACHLGAPQRLVHRAHVLLRLDRAVVRGEAVALPRRLEVLHAAALPLLRDDAKCIKRRCVVLRSREVEQRERLVDQPLVPVERSEAVLCSRVPGLRRLEEQQVRVLRRSGGRSADPRAGATPHVMTTLLAHILLVFHVGGDGGLR